MNKIPKILCLATMGLFLLVILQGATGFIPVRQLKGAYVSADKPQFSGDTFCNGQWQQQVDGYLKEHHGFREGAIRLYNQCLWSCFHHSTNPGSVVVGRDNYLFEPYFVDEYYEGCSKHYFGYADDPVMEMMKVSERASARLHKLQQLLEEQGVHLFVAMLPGKERIYPQQLPQRQGQQAHHRSAYQTYLNNYDRYDVRHIDLCHWFDQLNNGEVPYPSGSPYLLFTKTGTHWSNIASTYAFDSVMRYMQSFGPAIPSYSLGKPYSARLREPDADLDELLNKIFHIRAPRNQYVDVHLTEGDTTKAPSLIVIGDSFFWNVLYNYPVQQLFSNFRYWYYYSTIYYDPNHENVADVDLVEELLSADYVMLSYCTVQFYHLATDFVNQALLKLSYTPTEYQPVLDSLSAAIATEMPEASDTDRQTEYSRRLDRNLEHYFPRLL